MTTAPADLPKQTEPLTTGAQPQPTVPATASTPGVTAGEPLLEILSNPTSSSSEPATEVPASIDTTIKPLLEPPPSDVDTKLQTETVESVQPKILQQTTAKNEIPSPSIDNAGTGTTSVSSSEEVPITTITELSSGNEPSTSEPRVSTDSSTEPATSSSAASSEALPDQDVASSEISPDKDISGSEASPDKDTSDSEASPDKDASPATSQTELAAIDSVSASPVVIRELVLTEAATAEKLISSDSVISLSLNTQVSDIDNKEKNEIYESVNFIEYTSNTLATDVTTVTQHRNTKHTIQYIIQAFIQFLRRLLINMF